MQQIFYSLKWVKTKINYYNGLVNKIFIKISGFYHLKI